MKFETKYNVGDKVWLMCENVESYIQAHPYNDQQEILKSCFREGYVNIVKVETAIFGHEPLIISYVISNDRHLDDDPEDVALRMYGRTLFHSEQDVFSNFDEVTNMIKETHKDVLNGLKGLAEKILKRYE